jgi:hypothetical protein
MDGETIFIDRPIELELDGALVRAKVMSGARTVRFVLTIHNFLASFEFADLAIKEWQARSAIANFDVIPFPGH